MKSTIFRLSSMIFIGSFLYSFKMVCVCNGIFEGAAMYMFLYFMNVPGTATLAHQVCDTENDDSQKESKPSTWCQDVNYLIATFTSDDVTSEPLVEIMNLKQPEYTSTIRHSGMVWEELYALKMFKKSSSEGDL